MSLNMEKYIDPAEEKLKKNKNKKCFSPYKKSKTSLSKLEEYQNYLDHLKLMSNGRVLEL